MANIKNQKPVIGITGPENGGRLPWLFTKYSIMFHNRDIAFRRISPGSKPPPDDLRGLVIGGGSDINPVLYGQNVLTFKSLREESSILRKILAMVRMRLKQEIGVGYVQIEPKRDEMEFELLERAIENKIPVLGICRGAQMINVFFGGTLHQDIMSFKFENPNIKSILPKKLINIKPSSRLYDMLKTEECYVNSLHKQAVDEIGSDLTVSATDNNGIVQAVEHTFYPFVIGVQWHPEYLPQKRIQRNIFRKFLQEAVGK